MLYFLILYHRKDMIYPLILFFLLLTNITHGQPLVEVGLDRIFTPSFSSIIQGKKVGLITNHTAVNQELASSVSVFKKQNKKLFTLVALFGPEHGIHGNGYAEEKMAHQKDPDGIPIYSLHGKTRRPTKKMLQGINTLVFDIQDIGARSYTYISTLFYAMEEAAKEGITVVVLDRPNPINGVVIDGPMLDDSCRSYVSYINVPYCHGMTVGELAQYFNQEYKIGCKLFVVPMKGWKRTMSFSDTGLAWIPTSPHIPEAETPLYYPATGILGELQMVNIGVGYTLPFKCVGAPWIKADEYAAALNKQHFPGVQFHPFHFRPFFGRFAKKECHGVLIIVTDKTTFQPVSTQYLLIGILKSLYPKQFATALIASSDRKRMFDKVNGTKQIYHILQTEQYVAWKLKQVHEERRKAFAKKRKPYLLY